MKSWFLYVVRCSDNTLYTGITTDINRRVREHNFTHRGAKYTRSRRPVRLVYTRKVEDRSSALKAEHKFKKLTRQEKLREIRERKSDESH
jgi:putative endonuclease